MGTCIQNTVPEYTIYTVDLFNHIEPSDPIHVAPSYSVDSYWTL